jgi:hypothetical protein
VRNPAGEVVSANGATAERAHVMLPYAPQHAVLKTAWMEPPGGDGAPRLFATAHTVGWRGGRVLRVDAAGLSVAERSSLWTYLLSHG